MKKIVLLSIAVISFVSITKAQITKGSVYLGGNIGASTSKEETDNSSSDGKAKSLSINPAVGIAVRNNLITGVELYYNNSDRKGFINNQDWKTNNYGGGIFLRKYFPVTDRFSVFAQSGLGYISRKDEYLPMPGYSFGPTQYRSIVASIFPGLSIHVFKSFYLETAFNGLLQISYSSSTTTRNYNGTTSTSKQKDFSVFSSLNNNYNLNIGVRFIIPKK